MRLKILIILVLVFILILVSVLVINKDKSYTETDANNMISVVICTSDFNSIYHENVVIRSNKKYKIKKDDGIEVVPADNCYIFNIENMSVGQCYKIKASNNSKLKIESITRSYGIPEYFGDISIYRNENGFVIVNTLSASAIEVL